MLTTINFISFTVPTFINNSMEFFPVRFVIGIFGLLCLLNGVFYLLGGGKLKRITEKSLFKKVLVTVAISLIAGAGIAWVLIGPEVFSMIFK